MTYIYNVRWEQNLNFPNFIEQQPKEASMTQVSSAVDVLWNLYRQHPEQLSKVDWEYLIRNMADALAREILIKNMHEHIKPAQDKYEQQWRIANQVTLQRVGQCVADGGAVAYMDLIAAIDAGVDINILKYLISKCDNINGSDENGQTALHHCAQNYVSLDLVNELLIADANSAALDNKGLDARDYLDKDIWGDDYGTARMMLRPCWTYYYDE